MRWYIDDQNLADLVDGSVDVEVVSELLLSEVDPLIDDHTYYRLWKRQYKKLREALHEHAASEAERFHREVESLDDTSDLILQELLIYRKKKQAAYGISYSEFNNGTEF